jgi:hypothetical protein
MKPRKCLTLFPALVFAFFLCFKSEAAETDKTTLMDSLVVTRPHGNDWRVVKKTDTTIAYTISSQHSPESVAAYAATYVMPHPDTKDGFLQLVRENVNAMLTNGSFRPDGEIAFKYTEERGYPCVRASAAGKSHINNAVGELMIMSTQYRMILCKYPKSQEIGFMVGFSQNSLSPKKSIEAEAESFFHGVSVLNQGATVVHPDLTSKRQATR